MTAIRMQCPWCKQDVEAALENARAKDDKKKRRKIEIVQVNCPACRRIIQFSRLLAAG